MMRVAILDASPLTARTVARLLPVGVEYEFSSSIEEAVVALRKNRPDAVLIGLVAGHISWETILKECRKDNLPYLLYYSLQALPPGKPMLQLLDAAALSPIELSSLRKALHQLLGMSPHSQEKN